MADVTKPDQGNQPLLQQQQGGYPGQQQQGGYPGQQQQGYPPQQQQGGYPGVQQQQGYAGVQQPQGSYNNGYPAAQGQPVYVQQQPIANTPYSNQPYVVMPGSPTGAYMPGAIPPPGAMPGGYWMDEGYCGPISIVIGIFLLPCICCCPIDKRQVYIAPNGMKYLRDGCMV